MRAAIASLVLGGLALGAGAAQAAVPVPGPTFAAFKPVSDARLDHLRGGFTLSRDGITVDVAVGIGRIVSINGHIISVANLPQVHFGGQGAGTTPGPSTAPSSSGTPPAPQPQSVTSHTTSTTTHSGSSGPGASGVHVIQNGPNNFVSPALLHMVSGAGATVIQNTLDQQVIRTVNVMNVRVRSRTLARLMSLQTSLGNVLSHLGQ